LPLVAQIILFHAQSQLVEGTFASIIIIRCHGLVQRAWSKKCWE